MVNDEDVRVYDQASPPDKATPQGCSKLNFDSSALSIQGIAGIGGFIHDGIAWRRLVLDQGGAEFLHTNRGV